jgi:hypothetical protein
MSNSKIYDNWPSGRVSPVVAAKELTEKGLDVAT